MKTKLKNKNKNTFFKKLPHIFKNHINKYYSPNRQYAKFHQSIVIHEREIYILFFQKK